MANVDQTGVALATSLAATDQFWVDVDLAGTPTTKVVAYSTFFSAIPADILPDATGTRSLGSSAKRVHQSFLGGGTLTADSPMVDGARTWNNVAVTFTACKLNITDTASSSASMFLDCQIAGVSKASIRKDGMVRGLYLKVEDGGYILWNTKSVIDSPANGSILMSNQAGNDFTKLQFKSTSGPVYQFGTGSPESAVTAPVGSIYLRTDGGAATVLYIKESGAGNTGWVAK